MNLFAVLDNKYNLI